MRLEAGSRQALRYAIPRAVVQDRRLPIRPLINRKERWKWLWPRRQHEAENPKIGLLRLETREKPTLGRPSSEDRIKSPRAVSRNGNFVDVRRRLLGIGRGV